MDAVILAGGSGSRMERDFPKALIRIKGKQLISYQIDYFLKSGIDKIIVALGYKAELVIKFIKEKYNGKPVHYTVEDTPIGTAGAIKLGLKHANSDFVLVTNGDDVTDIKISELKKIKSDTICVCHPILPFGCVHEKNGYADFVEKPVLDEWVSCGWYVLDREKLLNILPDTGSIEYDIFPKIKLKLFKHNGFWATANSMKEIENFEVQKIPDVLK